MAYLADYKGKLSADQLSSLVDTLEERYREHHAKVQRRRMHFHNLPEADPVLPIPFDQGPKYQSDIPRRVHQELKSRLGENQARLVVKPLRENATNRKPANAMEHYFNEGIQLIQEHNETTLQDALSDGQIIDCYGILYWRKAEHAWPDVPDLDFLQPDDDMASPPEGYEAIYRDDDEPDDYAGITGKWRIGEDGNADKATERMLRGYRQTEADRQQQYGRSCAEAGFAWIVETPTADTCMFVRDVSLESQPAIGVVRRVVGVLEYIDALNAENDRGKPKVSLHEHDKDIPVYGEEPAPKHPLGGKAPGEYTYPSEAGFRDTITVYEIWTRKEFYEIAVGMGFEHDVVKAGPTPYGCAPFALAYAQFITSPDPILRAEPALEGVFRLKPLYDLWMSHQLVMGQQIALPFYYWKRVGSGEPMLNEKGIAVTFDQNTANAEVAPEGYELAKVEFELNPAYIESGRDLLQQLKEAAPPTGQAEFTSSTQPWAIRLQQQQQNVYPGRLIGSQGSALRKMIRNMAHVHSLPEEDGGFGTTYVYALTKDGVVDQDNVLELKPEDIKSLKVDVSITTQSGAERITLEEHGRTLYAAGLITLEQYYEDYLQSENPDEDVLNLKATKLYEGTVEPVIAQGALAAAFGQFFTFGANGGLIDYQGRPVTPAQVLLANGQQPTPRPQPQPGTTNGAVPGGGLRPQKTMPGMSQMAAPGTTPIAAGVAGA